MLIAFSHVFAQVAITQFCLVFIVFFKQRIQNLNLIYFKYGNVITSSFFLILLVRCLSFYLPVVAPEKYARVFYPNDSSLIFCVYKHPFCFLQKRT